MNVGQDGRTHGAGGGQCLAIEARAVVLLIKSSAGGGQVALDLGALQALVRVGARRLVASALQLDMRDQPPEVELASAKMPPMRCTVLSTMDSPGLHWLRPFGPHRRGKGLGQAGQLLGGTPAPWSRSLSSTQSSRPLAAMSTCVIPVSVDLP